MTEHEKLAANIFKKQGLDFEAAERAGGWTNAVWFNGDCVLRLSMKKNSDILRREAARAMALPLSVGYPKNIAAGITDGYEWIISERINGVPLSSIWGNLSWHEKAQTVKQILYIADSVHSVPVDEVEEITLKSAWYNSFDKKNSLADMERYVAEKIFSPMQVRVLSDILERFYDCRCAAPVLCHGDITTDNLLWNDGNIVSLLDFEHSVIAPRQLDIHSLVNLALIPYDEATDADIILLNEENLEIRKYVNEMIALFKPYLSNQSSVDLFMGYNVLYRQRFLEFWLTEPKGEIEKCDAYKKLVSFCDGNGGYLSRMFTVSDEV